MKKIIVAALFIASSAFAADTTSQPGEFGGHCALGLTKNMEVKTDCKINWEDTATNKKYCFSSEDAKAAFAKDTTGNLKLAETHYIEISAKASVDKGATAVKAGAMEAGKIVKDTAVQAGTAAKEMVKEGADKVAAKM